MIRKEHCEFEHRQAHRFLSEDGEDLRVNLCTVTLQVHVRVLVDSRLRESLDPSQLQDFIEDEALHEMQAYFQNEGDERLAGRIVREFLMADPWDRDPSFPADLRNEAFEAWPKPEPNALRAGWRYQDLRQLDGKLSYALREHGEARQIARGVINDMMRLCFSEKQQARKMRGQR